MMTYGWFTKTLTCDKPGCTNFLAWPYPSRIHTPSAARKKGWHCRYLNPGWLCYCPEHAPRWPGILFAVALVLVMAGCVVAMFAGWGQ